MNKKQTQWLMIGLILTGLILISTGICFAIFTDITTTGGVNGILTVAGLVTGGLLISVPAKIYLTFLTMKASDK
jgi:hypothetical protein